MQTFSDSIINEFMKQTVSKSNQTCTVKENKEHPQQMI